MSLEEMIMIRLIDVLLWKIDGGWGRVEPGGRWMEVLEADMECCHLGRGMRGIEGKGKMLWRG